MSAETPTQAKRLSLGQNAAVNLGGKGVGIVLSLVVSAYVVNRLGLRAFGFWAIISAISQYAQLLDFGVGFSLTRFVAHYDELGDHGELQRKAASGLWGSVAFAVGLTGLAAAVTAALPHSVTAGWPPGWQIATICTAASLGFASIASVFQAFPNGMGRWDLSNLAGLAGQVVYSALAVATLASSRSLAGLGAAGACGALATCAIAYISKRRLWPQRLSIRSTTLADLRELWRYGVTVQMVNLVVVVNAQADKPILLAFAPLSFVGLYELGARVAYTIRALPITAFGPLIAASAREAALGDRLRLRRFYERSYEKVVALGVAPLAAFYGASYVLIIAWIGAHYRTSAVIAVILGVGYTINIATGAGTALAMGAGRPELDRNYSVIGFVLNMVLTVTLGIAFGRWGVIAATALGLALSSIWLIRSIDKWLGSSVLSWRGIAGSRQSLVLLLLGVFTGAATAWGAIAIDVSNRLEALGIGAGALAAFAVVWLAATSRMGLFSIRSLLPARSSAPATPIEA